MREFLATEAAGGVVLVVAMAAALVWANSPWKTSYASLWSADVGIRSGRHDLTLGLRQWVNDGLMALFFLVAALEVKRELLTGELRDRRRAALPVVAAVGGMVVPALIYAVANPSSPAARGWGVPMATDIAFAVGVLALVAPRIPPSLRLFLLTLAIVDDIGAIVVIAVAYSAGIEAAWLAVALVIVGVVAGLWRAGVRSPPLFVGLGVVLWWATYASGVHATLAGVAMGLLVPATPARAGPRTVSPLEWLEHRLHGWTSLVIVPVFALANAGVELSAHALRESATSRITLGVALGLVVGKTVGITLACWLAVRLGAAELPTDASWRHVVGVATLAGIGFTVSLFVTSLAFSDAALADQAKIGVLAASLLAALLAAVILRWPGRRVGNERAAGAV